MKTGGLCCAEGYNLASFTRSVHVCCRDRHKSSRRDRSRSRCEPCRSHCASTRLLHVLALHLAPLPRQKVLLPRDASTSSRGPERAAQLQGQKPPRQGQGQGWGPQVLQAQGKGGVRQPRCSSQAQTASLRSVAAFPAEAACMLGPSAVQGRTPAPGLSLIKGCIPADSF